MRHTPTLTLGVLLLLAAPPAPAQAARDTWGRFHQRGPAEHFREDRRGNRYNYRRERWYNYPRVGHGPRPPLLSPGS